MRHDPGDRSRAGGSGTLTGVRSLVTGTIESETYCAILTSGGVDCWGYDGSDELGDGATGDTFAPNPVTGVGGTGTLSGVSNLSMNDAACAALTSGGVACWGGDGDGQLGNGVSGLFDESAVPVAVEGVGGTGTLGGVASVAVAGGAVCGLLTGGGVDCWGDNGSDELGAGTSPGCLGECATSPLAVFGLGGKGKLGGVASVVGGLTGGGEMYCAVLKSAALGGSGGSDCWGGGPLGNGSIPDTLSNVPVQVKGIGGAGALSGIGSVAIDIPESGEDGTACAVLRTGTVGCWGTDLSGELGNRTMKASGVPVAVLAPSS